MGSNMCTASADNSISLFGNMLDSDTRSLLMILDYSNVKLDFREAYVANDHISDNQQDFDEDDENVEAKVSKKQQKGKIEISIPKLVVGNLQIISNIEASLKYLAKLFPQVKFKCWNEDQMDKQLLSKMDKFLNWIKKNLKPQCQDVLNLLQEKEQKSLQRTVFQEIEEIKRKYQMINDQILKRLDERLKEIKEQQKVNQKIEEQQIYFSEKSSLNAIDIFILSDVAMIAALGNHGNVRVPNKYRDLNTWIELMLQNQDFKNIIDKMIENLQNPNICGDFLSQNN